MSYKNTANRRPEWASGPEWDGWTPGTFGSEMSRMFSDDGNLLPVTVTVCKGRANHCEVTIRRHKGGVTLDCSFPTVLDWINAMVKNAAGGWC